jgi:hypothetical protein
MSNQGIGPHSLGKPIYEVLSVNGVDDPAAVTELLLKVLGDHGVIEYGVSKPILLTATGRVLSSIALRPEITISELQMVLGAGASSVTQAISALVANNLVARTKVGRKNQYEIVTPVTQNHADIRRFVGLYQSVMDTPPETGPDSTQN